MVLIYHCWIFFFPVLECDLQHDYNLSPKNDSSSSQIVARKVFMMYVCPLNITTLKSILHSFSHIWSLIPTQYTNLAGLQLRCLISGLAGNNREGNPRGKFIQSLKNKTKICSETRKETKEAEDSQQQAHFPVTISGVNEIYLCFRWNSKRVIYVFPPFSWSGIFL